MKFDCRECGKVDEAIVQGQWVGDVQLEELQFIVSLDDKHKARVKLDEYNQYIFDDLGLSEKVWFKRVKEFAEQNDVFQCAKCGDDVIPDDMLDEEK
jgi:hypothetical protein